MSTLPLASPPALRVPWPGRIWRSHLLFAVLLTAGLALRLATTFAYHPALIYRD